MSEYRKLLQLLEKELYYQEQLLAVLARERVAVVKMNQEEINRLNQEKNDLFDSAREIEVKRNLVIGQLKQELPSRGEAPQSEKESPTKLSDLIVRCPSKDIRLSLERVGRELKRTAESTFELNRGNASLIKQALGLVATTIAIFRSSAGTDLPTYGANGSLRSSEDPAFVSRTPSSITRQA